MIDNFKLSGFFDNIWSKVTILLFMSAIISFPTFRDPGKNLIYLLVALSLVFVIRHHKNLVPVSRLQKWFFIVLLLNFAWIAFTYYLNESPSKGNALLWNRQSFLVMLVPLFYLFSHVSVSHRIVLATLVLSVLFSFYTSIQDIDPTHLGKYGRRAHGGHNPVSFGYLIMTMAIYLVFSTLLLKQKQLRIVSAIAAAIALLIVIWTQSRGVWVAILVLPLVILFYETRSWSLSRRMLILVISIGLLGASYLHPTVKFRVDLAVSQFTQYIASDSVDDVSRGLMSSIGTRLEMWKAGLKTFQDHPLTGVGIGGYRGHVEKNAQRYQINESGYAHFHPHSQYITALATRGFPGFILIVMIIAIPTLIAHRAMVGSDSKDKLSALSIIGISLCFMVFGLVDVPFESKPSILFYSIMMAYLMASLNKARIDKQGS